MRSRIARRFGHCWPGSSRTTFGTAPSGYGASAGTPSASEVSTAPSPTPGSVEITPLTTTEYQLYVLTEQGGTRETETFFVGEIPGLVFMDGFEDNNTDAWTNSFNEN